ncbi:MAG: ABC transporter substrate-binding protein [Chloroflexi bacterium]|nr:ABC transporter substrate-binding protein [Chloroflexota bacterium]
MEPQRVVSLVPSLTELLFWLGRGDRVVGRTRFCTEPAGEVERAAVVGGTKDPDLATVQALRPDLVVANKEENRREDVEALRSAGIEVLLTDPNSVDEAAAMIVELGRRVGANERAQMLVHEIEEALTGVEPGTGLRVFVGVWRKPLLGLGSETYGSDLIERCGGVNVLSHLTRYPEVALESLAALRPEMVLLPDEPYAWRQAHAAEFAAVAPARVIDGKWLWWYGPRMPAAIRQLRALLAPSPPGPLSTFGGEGEVTGRG